MIKIKANIRFYEKEIGRKTPFLSGYRPLFNFIPEMKVSGQISLLDRIEFYPGDEGVVEIIFLSKEFLGETFGVGTKFFISEGLNFLGEGEVVEWCLE